MALPQSPPSHRATRSQKNETLIQLTDETGAAVQSEKLLEIDFRGDTPVRAGDQFGLGRKK